MSAVLIVTNEQDLAADLVVLELARRDVDVLRCNTERLGDWRVRVDPGRAWELRDQHGRVAQSTGVRAVWWRRPEPPAHLDGQPAPEREVMVEQWQRIMEALQWTPGARWYSPPAAIHAAEDKARQLSVARELGFRIPQTIWTNDRAAADEMRPEVVLKTVTAAAWEHGGEASFVFAHAVPTDELPDAGAFEQVPAVFQRPVSPKRDVRVTVVDDRCLAAEHDPAPDEPIDWRLEVGSSWHPANIPADDQHRCVELVHRLGLRYGAIDLVRDDAGDLWFLEINPNGEWGWLQAAGLGVVEALCDAFVS